MGLGADIWEWVQETGYEGDDPYSAWLDDLMYRAEEILAHDARDLTWQSLQNQDQAEEVPKNKARVVHTSTNATCSACKQKKAKRDFSKRQWKTKGAHARCMSCVNKQRDTHDS